MKLVRTLLISFSFLCCFALSVWPAYIEDMIRPDIELYFSGKKIQLETPLIAKDGKLFFPLNDFFNLLSIKLTYLPKDQIYEILFARANKSCILVPNSTELWVGTQTINLSAANFEYQRQFYLPLEDFFKFINYNVTISNKKIYIVADKTAKAFFNLPGLSKKIKIVEPEKINITNLAVSTNINQEKVAVTPAVVTPNYAPLEGFTCSINQVYQITNAAHGFAIINASNPFEYKEYLASYNSGLKLIIDIPNSKCNLTSTINAKGGFYTLIRTSQFQRVPKPITRVVFDLSSKNVTYIIKHTPASELSIEFFLASADKATWHKKEIAHPPSENILMTLENKLQKSTTPEPPKPKYVHKKDSRIIVLDPGHGGADPGAISETGEQEKAYTLDISSRLKKLLVANGKTVFLTREGDETVSLPKRVEMANDKKAAIFISIHINSFTRDYANGIETYYHKPSERNLAMVVHKEMAKALDTRNNGIKIANMYVSRYAEMPTILVEPLYLTNPKEHKLIADPVFRQKLAEALFNGIIKYLDTSTH